MFSPAKHNTGNHYDATSNIKVRSKSQRGGLCNLNTLNRIWIAVFLAFGYGGYLLFAAIANIYSYQSSPDFSIKLFNKPKIFDKITSGVFHLANYHYIIIIVIFLILIFNSLILTQAQSELAKAKSKICQQRDHFSKSANLFANFSILTFAAMPLLLFVLTGSQVYLTDWYYFGLGAVALFIVTIVWRFLCTLSSNKNPVPLITFFSVEILITIIVISLAYLVFFYAWILIGLLLVITITTDVGAWFAGSLIGKTKITKISPNKSYQGLIAGSIFATIVSILYCYLVFFKLLSQDVSENWNFLIIIGCAALILSLVAQGSDICFSAIKREGQIKDFSTIFRSHGGVLDRFDGFIGCYFFGAMVLGLILYYFPH